METESSLDIADYVVVALILLISLGIGVLYAVKDFKNANRVEYLLGGRSMFMLPVALSVFATFTSGISILGQATEVYMYGVMPVTLFVGVGIGYIFAAFSIVPLIHPLRMTSLYEYLELRFESRVVRIFAVVTGMLQTLCYMSIALLSTGLALQTGAGLPLWMSIGVVGFIGTVYTAIGGIKSVIWTDVFQGLVMLGGLLAIILKGSSIVGGGDAVWKISQAGGRTSFNQVSLDPRTRNTWWGTIIGGSFLCLSVICNQSSMQRISAMKSVKDARKAYLLNSVLFMLYGGLLLGNSWVVYAYFSHIRCDPFQAGLLKNRNQLSPHFVMSAMKDLPAIRGVFLAMIFSATLSTISSGINSLAANTVEDLITKMLHNVPESTATLVTKVMVFIYGILIIGLAYGINSIQGPLTQIAIAVVGACGGPILGIFLLGALFPWTNRYGAFGGGVVALVINVWIVVGNQLYGRKNRMLPLPSTDMCFLNNSVNGATSFNLTELYFNHQKVNDSNVHTAHTVGEDPYGYGFFLYDISFEWYGFIGALVSLVLGLVISCCTRRYCTSITDKKFLFPIVRKFWLLESPKQKDEDPRKEAVCMIKISETEVTQHIKCEPVTVTKNDKINGTEVNRNIKSEPVTVTKNDPHTKAETNISATA